MRPQLETLESRDMLDAVLANAFLTYLAPQMVQTTEALIQIHEREAATVISMATAQAAVMGPQFAAQQLPAVLSATQEFLDALPSLRVAVATEIVADYQLLMQLPSGSNEIGAVLATAAEVQTLGNNMDGF